MSATYNWAYRPGITNKYNLTIASSADNVKPSNACYVALFGNDSTGNGSRQLPYRTFLKVITLYGGTNTIFIFGSGVWREDMNSLGGSKIQNNAIVGDGDVKIDYSFTGYGGLDNNNLFYNVTLIGSGLPISSKAPSILAGSQMDVYFKSTVYSNGALALLSGTFTNCVFDNYANYFLLGAAGGQFCVFNNCTFYNMNFLDITYTKLTSCIFVRCNIEVKTALDVANPRYSLFYQCNWRFNTTQGIVGPTYPSTPTGFTYFNTLADIQAAYITSFPTALSQFPSCIMADPLFNNPAIGDYTLQFSSPAKNLSYLGNYVGAFSIAQSIKVKAMENAGGFEFSGAINCTIADDSLTLTDTALDAQIDTKPIVNILGREISRLPSFGFNADRNGQYIDSIADLSGTTYAAGDALPTNMPFLVESGSITYNGIVYQAGERGTTVTAATIFTTSTSGTMREITEAPQRHTIMARFTDGGATVSIGAPLTSGYYYYVTSSSVTYNSIIYNTGDIFKAINTNAFTGPGSVIVAFSTEIFQHYEPGIRPTSNNVGDARTGAIIRGNGDPAYVRGGLSIQEFPINAKFIQIRYIIRVSNLKP